MISYGMFLAMAAIVPAVQNPNSSSYSNGERLIISLQMCTFT